MKLITIVYHDTGLLPFFLGHYAALGVTQFLIGVYEQGVGVEAVSKLCKNYRHEVFPIAGPYGGPKDSEIRHRIATQYIAPDEWWVIADIDEFHEYPTPLAELIADLERDNYSYLQSYLLDRIVTDGTSPALRSDIPLWDQFPAAAYIYGVLMAALSTKIMLVKGPKRMIAGHHDPGPRMSGRIKQGGIVHHFKWFGNVAAKIEQRRQIIIANGHPQFRKCDRFLRYWMNTPRLPIHGEFGFHFPTKPSDWPDVVPQKI